VNPCLLLIGCSVIAGSTAAASPSDEVWQGVARRWAEADERLAIFHHALSAAALAKRVDHALLVALESMVASLEELHAFEKANVKVLESVYPGAAKRLVLRADALRVARALVVTAEREGVLAVVDRLNETLRLTPWASARISAAAGWVSTGFEVRDGSDVRVRAIGTWTISPKVEAFDADGAPHSGLFDVGAYRGVPVGALLCRIGRASKFYAGKALRFRSDRNGDIECRINDVSLENNAGEVEVTLVEEAERD
jgi:hypothetical protein